jgi:cephalosporin hydroxylase
VSWADINNYMPLLEEYASQAAYILEMGVGEMDGSTVAFTKGLERRGGADRMYISIDNDGGHAPEANYPQVPYWVFLVGDSRDPLTRSAIQRWAEDRKPDLIFIDTHHVYEHMEQELKVWGSYAHDKTLWLFHDTYMFGPRNHMVDAIQEWADANGWEYFDIRTDQHGLGGMRKK